MTIDVVVPTAGRSSLARLLAALAAERVRSRALRRIVVVDDRPSGEPLALPDGVELVRAHGRGPAAARNAGWRATSAEWVAFLDDDVEPSEGWAAALTADLERATPRTAGVQGRVRVPLAAGRRATDRERSVAGLERARWATADMAYRRSALELLGGFDERFPRAYREDTELALRALAAGLRLEQGRRVVVHPVRDVPWWASLSRQRGNADDALMRRLHGAGWRTRGGAPAGRLPRHLGITLAGVTAAGAALARRRALALAATAAWAVGTAELAWARIAPGPRDAPEVAAMLVTSIAVPPLAVVHRLAGELRARRLAVRPRAVLFDRDGTLIEDVPYNGDPERVVVKPGARAAVERLREAGVPTAVVTNQSAIGRGLLTRESVEAVNRRVEELLGPLGPWLSCPHAPDAGCSCRKPKPGLVRAAAAVLGVHPSECVVIGDIGADAQAALAAGARGILVPTPETRREEVEAAPEVAPTLPAAVELALGGRR